MFAHNIEEQKKESNREFIYNMIYIWNNLSNININENKDLFSELIIYTKECKNCINKKCSGGYNCKFGACLKELRICHNDLINGKCNYPLKSESKVIKRCINGIHLTEKDLIPYYQRISCEIGMLDYGIYLYDNINYYSKINAISLLLNDKTIKIVKSLINKNKFTNNRYDYDNIMNYNNNVFQDDLFMDDILHDNNNNNNNTFNDLFWRKNNLRDISAVEEIVCREDTYIPIANNDTDIVQQINDNIQNIDLHLNTDDMKLEIIDDDDDDNS